SARSPTSLSSNAPPRPHLYPLSLHDALPIWARGGSHHHRDRRPRTDIPRTIDQPRVAGRCGRILPTRRTGIPDRTHRTSAAHDGAHGHDQFVPDGRRRGTARRGRTRRDRRVAQLVRRFHTRPTCPGSGQPSGTTSRPHHLDISSGTHRPTATTGAAPSPPVA